MIRDHLRIERFAEKVSSTLYSNRHDSVGLVSDEQRQTFVTFLASDFAELEGELSTERSGMTVIYLRAALLHLRLSAFFSPPSLPSYRADLLELYHATISYLDACLGLDTCSDSGFLVESGHGGRPLLVHGTNYIFQMMLAAGFALMKLQSSFMEQVRLDATNSQNLFSKALSALRSMSVQENDLAQRLAEVLAQVWKGSRAGAGKNGFDAAAAGSDESMQLKVRCRMSVSLVYDSVWRWREEAHRRGITLECEYFVVLLLYFCCWMNRKVTDLVWRQPISNIPLIRPLRRIREQPPSPPAPVTLHRIRHFDRCLLCRACLGWRLGWASRVVAVAVWLPLTMKPIMRSLTR